MAKQNERATEIWKLVERGKDYNNRLDYYSTVEKNERFAFGNQWEGVKSNGLPTPSFNIFKRVINYMVAYLTSTPIKIQYTVQNISADTEDAGEQLVLQTTSDTNKVALKHWEDNKIDDMVKDWLIDGTISGDYASHTYWDTSIETGQEVIGDFVDERIDGVNIILANPNDRRINFRGKAFQEYVIVLGRTTIDKLRAEAVANGKSEQEAKIIGGDNNTEETAGERGKVEQDGSDKANYAIYYWYDKETKTVHFIKTTKELVITKDAKNGEDTGIKLYPVAWGNWDRRKNSYHGQALLTNYIPNQIYINKQMSMMMLHYMQLAIPKIAYNKNKIDGWNNQVGGEIPMDGDPSGAFQVIEGANMPSGITSLVQDAISQTTQALGANDVLLGNVKPDNTSAIIQVTEQANTPLLNQMTSLYDFIEQLAQIWFEFIKVKYGNIVRTMTVPNDKGSEVIQYDASKLIDKIVTPKIEVGPSTWWSENKQVETLDNLYQSGIIDVLQYLRRMPDGYIPKLDELIKEIEEKSNMQSQYEMMAQFISSLPAEEQVRLKSLPDDEMEKEVLAMMNGQTGGEQNKVIQNQPIEEGDM